MCLRKGIREPYEVIDHVIPVSKGGTGWPANLRPACGRCNLAKSARNWRFMMLPELLKKLGAE
jgi:5-methylcytosine-specific restriction endonuclease McrA